MNPQQQACPSALHGAQTHAPEGLAKSNWQFPLQQQRRKGTEHEHPSSHLSENGLGGRATEPFDLDMSDDASDGFVDLTEQDNQEESYRWITESSQPRTLPTATDPLDLDTSDDDFKGFVDLTELEDQEESYRWITETIEPRTPPASLPTTRRRSSPLVLRNLPICVPSTIIKSVQHKGFNINPKAYVELIDGTFMKVLEIIQDITTEMVTLRGWVYKRNKAMNGNLERGPINELCWIMLIDEDDDRSHEVQCMVTVPVHDVQRRRRIRLTNRPYPDLSWRQDPRGESNKTVEKERALVCRLKYICLFTNAKAREKNSVSETIYQRLRADECDRCCDIRNEPYAGIDSVLRDAWRGVTVKGGACRKWQPGEEEFLMRELNDHQAGQNSTHPLLRQPASSMNQGMVAKLVTSTNVRNWHGKAQPPPIDLTSETVVLGPSQILSPRAFSSLQQGIKTIDLTGTTNTSATINHVRQDQRNLSLHSRTILQESGRKVKAIKLSHGISESNFAAGVSGHRYTFGESFCGAGGTSRGAILAGLRVQWGFDFNLAACQSYALNFHGATVYSLSTDQFIRMLDPHDSLQVDVMHISPPCGYFSRAHTTPGKDDEANQAALLATGQLLDKAKPRVVTFEEVDGLTDNKHSDFFTALIRMFTTRDFSIRWKVYNLASFGLSQERKRLLMIASW